MIKNLSRAREGSHVRTSTKRMLLSLLVISAIGAFPAKAGLQESLTHQTGQLENIQFSPPSGFQLQGSGGPDLVFIKANAYEGGLFVVISPSSKLSEQNLIEMSRRLASEFLPQDTSFSWKVLAKKASVPKLDARQTDQFAVKAVNDKKFVQTEFVLLRVKGKNVLAGLITRFGTESDSRFLYEVDGKEYSFPGWRGLFELLGSIK